MYAQMHYMTLLEALAEDIIQMIARDLISTDDISYPKDLNNEIIRKC